MGRVSGKVALVTGGAMGIGAATCRALAREGAAVVVADIADAPGRALAEEIAAAGGRALFLTLDIRSEAAWAQAAERTHEAFGKLNILVNNAAVGMPFGDVEHQSLEDWRTVMAVNGDGVFLGIREAIRVMRRTGEPGSIVNLSSAAALVGMSMSSAYSASKGAVRSLTKVAAIYCAREGLPIRVNSVHPGYILTEMFETAMGRDSDKQVRMRQYTDRIPMGRFGEPEDVANSVLYLASDESAYMTGAELVIDGGFTAQ